MRPTRYFDDYALGDVFVTDSVTVTESQILRFAREFDTQVFHTNLHETEGGPFGGLIGSGIQTFNLSFALFFTFCDAFLAPFLLKLLIKCLTFYMFLPINSKGLRKTFIFPLFHSGNHVTICLRTAIVVPLEVSVLKSPMAIAIAATSGILSVV